MEAIHFAPQDSDPFIAHGNLSGGGLSVHRLIGIDDSRNARSLSRHRSYVVELLLVITEGLGKS